MLLCILILGVGGSFAAIHTVNSYWENVEGVVVEEEGVVVEKEGEVAEEEVAVEEMAVLCSLTTDIRPSGSGIIDPNSGKYDSGDRITLTATPSPGYEFDRWSGTDSDYTNPTTVTMNSNRSIIAYFTEIKCSLSTMVDPPGSGSISPSSGSYRAGSSITLTATPASGYRFSHWSGDASGTTSPITITMDRDKNVVANFEKIRYTLRTSISPSGSGSVSPGSDTYDAGVNVSLTATPASGYRFSHWSGDVSGSSSTITITMDRDKNVIANFEKIRYILSTSVSPSGSGSISPNSGTYDAGTGVTLTASSASGYQFSHWSGDASGTSPTVTVAMDRDKNVVANFQPCQRVEFEISGHLLGWPPKWVQYSKWLNQGEKIVGSVTLEVGPLAYGWTHMWRVEIYDPANNVSWSQNKKMETGLPSIIEFNNFTAPYAGEYKIRISQGDFYNKPGTMIVCPPGWR